MIKRKILQAAVAATLLEIGFDSAQQLALETLTELLQSYIVEIGDSSRGYCELAGRTEPLYADVLLALVNMGLNVSEIEEFARREKKCVISPPLQMTQPKPLNILQAGVKQPHPSHIATHLPPFPDPHAYIRTPTHKQPVTEYEAIREKAAEQKRDLERALNRFMAKTGDTDSLFTSPDSAFPLIACKPVIQPYLTALLPKDQVFEFEDEYSPHHVSAAPAPRSSTSKHPQGALSTPGSTQQTSGKSGGKSAKEAAVAAALKQQASGQDQHQEEEAAETDRMLDEDQERKESQDDVIDNPYLRPVKIPPPKIKIKDLLSQ